MKKMILFLFVALVTFGAKAQKVNYSQARTITCISMQEIAEIVCCYTPGEEVIINIDDKKISVALVGHNILIVDGVYFNTWTQQFFNQDCNEVFPALEELSETEPSTDFLIFFAKVEKVRKIMKDLTQQITEDRLEKEEREMKEMKEVFFQKRLAVPTMLEIQSNPITLIDLKVNPSLFLNRKNSVYLWFPEQLSLLRENSKIDSFGVETREFSRFELMLGIGFKHKLTSSTNFGWGIAGGYGITGAEKTDLNRPFMEQKTYKAQRLKGFVMIVHNSSLSRGFEALVSIGIGEHYDPQYEGYFVRSISENLRLGFHAQNKVIGPRIECVSESLTLWVVPGINPENKKFSMAVAIDIW